MNVVKRDATLQPFDRERIVNAIMKAMTNGSGVVRPNIAEDIADEIAAKYRDQDEISIYDIEEDVYNKLNEKNQQLTARAYDSYRAIHTFQRETHNSTDADINTLIEDQNEYWKDENANKDPGLNTTKRDYIAGAVSTDFVKRTLPPEIIQAHNEGIIHFHDADYFIQHSHNCDLINLEDMLQNGTVISGTMIEKPHSFSTACNVATQIIAQVASSQYGGQSISLAHLAPFVQVSRDKIKCQTKEEVLFSNPIFKLPMFKKKLKHKVEAITEKRLMEEVRKGIQTIQYQLVTLMTTNGQAPFITVFMYLNEAKNEQEKKDLSLLIEEMLHQRIKGVKNEEGVWTAPAFPKLIYCLEEDNIHEDSPYWYLTRLAAECSSKRLVPDYISEKVMLQLKNDVFPAMGCRSFLTPDRFTDKLGNMANAKNYDGKHKYYGRFNQGVVTINLADVALSSGGDIDTFWNIFDERLKLCHKALRLRHERLKGTSVDVAPILWRHGGLARLPKGAVIDPLLYGGYSTISLGYAGLYEAVKYMTGSSHSDGDKGERFGLAIMQHMNDACNKWKKEENIDYSLYGTPLESTTYKFAKCLKTRFGVIEGITDRNYITNSYHIPVFEKIDAFNKLAIESKFQALSPGGAISYIETPNMSNNVDALLQVITFMYDHIMYAEINTKSCYCEKCGYSGDIPIEDKNGILKWICPQCGNDDSSTMDIAFRVCGYIGTAKNGANQGRMADVHDRVYHLDNMEVGQ
ncbi:ribonucleoside-triphosphate reductase class III catalytic subunit [Lachnospiraceae bacterium KHCPX20]|nr:ribonucleoside-triphosphate reductase class III catalytic subunit [Lachnospiraceae bacterium KHCPX20]